VTLVFDASVAVKWFMAEPDSPAAVAARASASQAIAPELIIAEILNASWLALRRQQLAPGQFHQVAATAPRYLDRLVPLTKLAARAGLIAARLDHPVYDCFYLALAEREAASLVTADGRLKRRAAGSPWADLISDLADFVPS
jgi:predicted nucleic acid-binding protein